MDTEKERIRVTVTRELGDALIQRVGVGRQPPHHERVHAVARAAALQDVNNVFREYEEFLRQRPWRDKGELEQLRRAKNLVEILASGAVALKTQDDPSEVARLEGALSAAQVLANTRTRELGEARLELSRVREDLGQRVQDLEQATRETLHNLAKQNALVEKLNARLRKSRAKARGLGARLVEVCNQLETIKLLASSIITTAEVNLEEVPDSPVISGTNTGLVYTGDQG